jgi:hypothetical protein
MWTMSAKSMPESLADRNQRDVAADDLESIHSNHVDLGLSHSRNLRKRRTLSYKKLMKKLTEGLDIHPVENFLAPEQ